MSDHDVEAVRALIWTSHIPIHRNYLPMLRFNTRHWRAIAIYTFELLILGGQCQPSLEMRACVSLGDLP